MKSEMVGIEKKGCNCIGSVFAKSNVFCSAVERNDTQQRGKTKKRNKKDFGKEGREGMVQGRRGSWTEA